MLSILYHKIFSELPISFPFPLNYPLYSPPHTPLGHKRPGLALHFVLSFFLKGALPKPPAPTTMSLYSIIAPQETAARGAAGVPGPTAHWRDCPWGWGWGWGGSGSRGQATFFSLLRRKY